MKNKEFKLLVESWRNNFIVEANDEDNHNNNNNNLRFDSGEAASKNYNPAYEDFKNDSEQYDNQNTESEEELIKRFCMMFDIEEGNLRDFLSRQAFMGGVEELESGEVLNPKTGEPFGDDEEIH